MFQKSRSSTRRALQEAQARPQFSSLPVIETPGFRNCFPEGQGRLMLGTTPRHVSLIHSQEFMAAKPAFVKEYPP